MLICVQSGRVSGLEQKTDPASSARSKKKGLKDKNNQLLGFVNKFCIPFGTEIKIPICGGLDSELRISELSTLIRILSKPGGV